jgi:hypothetical protein
MDNGKVPRNGASTEGVDSWRDLMYCEKVSKLGEEEVHTLGLCTRLRHGVLHVPKLEPTTLHQLCRQSFLPDPVVKQSTRYSQLSWCWHLADRVD